MKTLKRIKTTILEHSYMGGDLNIETVVKMPYTFRGPEYLVYGRFTDKKRTWTSDLRDQRFRAVKYYKWSFDGLHVKPIMKARIARIIEQAVKVKGE